MTVRILQGDCRDVLRTLPPESVHAIVTDPPYELGFMGKAWDSTGIAYNVEMWRECLRVLKPGGHLLAFGGSRTYHRLACAIEDAGFDVRDQIMWLYGSGFPKSHNLDGDWQGWGTALKPAHEPIAVARKPLIGTVAANVLAHGTGAINIDACRVEASGRPRIVSSNEASVCTFGDGLNGSRAAGTTDFGRWPANVIHDGSDKVLRAFPDAAGQQGDLTGQSKGRKSKGIFGDMPAAREHSARVETDTSAARFFYCAKASREDRNVGCDELPDRLFGMSGAAAAAAARGEHYDNGDGGVNRVTSRKNNHPTVKPTELMRYLVRLITPPGGTVLDPFAGSGSTGRAASIEGFDAILIELNPDYAAIARKRICGDSPLFAQAISEVTA